MKIVTAAQMQALDRRTIEEAGIPGARLMERAGAGVVTEIERRYGPVRGKTITILSGKGNNGGDGFVSARVLKRKGAKIHVVLLSQAKDLSRDASVMYRRLVGSAGRSVVSTYSDEVVGPRLAASDLVIDALLGTGLSSEVTGSYRAAIDLMNKSGKPIVAVDVPSGLHADTGAVMGSAVRAALTATFGLPKLGLYTGAGIDYAGDVRIVDIGIPARFIEAVESRELRLSAAWASRALPIRRPSAHKGTFGHAGIIAGSAGKTGAAALAAQAALRVGAGLVTVATPASVNDILEAKLLEAMTLPLPETSARTLGRASAEAVVSFMQARSAVAVGPGLSTHAETVELVRSLLPHLDRPSVLDADALNALAGCPALLSQCKIPPVLTPHPGEMARLDGDGTTQSVNSDRIGIARRFAREHNCFVILKGARSVVARPDGLVAVNPTGNPGMATAGTGDVLTGMVVGLLAQGVDAWDAACSAVYLHGLAGDLAAIELGQAGMLARDLIAQIPHAFKTIAP